MIEVRLFAHFRSGRDKVMKIDVEDFPTPGDILSYLKINEEDVAILLVNGFHSPVDHVLKDGDIVAFFPPVAGG